MRLIVRLAPLPRPVAVPVNHQHLLAGLVYRLLRTSDEEYARFLHDEGYAADEEEDGAGRKRFKLFTFSWLQAQRRRTNGPTLYLGPGLLEWQVASPVAPFLTHCATGLLAEGALRVGDAILPIEAIETRPAPAVLGETTSFTCLTPIVASVPRPDRTTQYLRPGDGEAFSTAVRNNLLRKHRALHGRPPNDERLRLDFDQAYLNRNRHGGTKKITVKNIDHIGAFAPFTLSGSPELTHLAWECGLGEKNSMGFGMVDMRQRLNGE